MISVHGAGENLTPGECIEAIYTLRVINRMKL